MTALPQHSSKSVEWYTPPDIVDRARRVMGDIDLDPASCAEAQRIVKAYQFYTEADDGLSKVWAGRVFLNPPGGREKGRTGSRAARWLEHLMCQVGLNRVSQAVFVGFSLEILQTCQRLHLNPFAFQICIPSKRIAYVSPSGEFRSPPHASVILGLGTDPDCFRSEFSEIGAVLV